VTLVSLPQVDRLRLNRRRGRYAKVKRGEGVHDPHEIHGPISVTECKSTRHSWSTSAVAIDEELAWGVESLTGPPAPGGHCATRHEAASGCTWPAVTNGATITGWEERHRESLSGSGPNGQARPRTARLSWVVTAALVFAPTLTWLLASPPPSAAASTAYYLALGDSVPVWNGTDSYPYQIAAHYVSTTPNLQVVDMACSGETSGTMISGSLCAPGPSHSQQQEALSFLNAHQGSVVLVTIDIGGNDLLPCVNGISVNIVCIQQAEATMVTNLDAILAGIRQSAGSSVPIIGMNYYDPFLGDWLAGGSVQAEAVLSVSLVTELNNLLTGAYQNVAAPVADVASAFKTTDLTDTVSSPWGEIPVAVANACQWLDITCKVGQLEGFGDDPVMAGASVIAQAFEQTIGPSIQPTTTTTTTSTSTTTSTTEPGSSVTTTSVPVQTASASSSLAFTGSGQPTIWMAGAGLVLLLGGTVAFGFSVFRSKRVDLGRSQRQ
jgi:hypothetical protein